MSQHDFVIDNQSFPATRTDLNAAILAVASNSSGATAPTTTYANQFWYDTSTNILYIRNEANDGWVSVITLDASMTATASELNQLDAITRGSILYGNASGVTSRLAKGAAATVLTSDGTDISWQAAASSGYRTLLSTTTISDDATVLITGLDSTYSEYQFVITDLLSNDSDGYPLRMRVQANSAIDSTSGNYRFSVIYSTSNSNTLTNGFSGTNHDHIDLSAVMDSASPDTSHIIFNIINPSGTTNNVRGYGRFVDMYNGVLYQGPLAFSYVPVTYAVTGLQFYNAGSSGTLKSGTIKLYGIS